MTRLYHHRTDGGAEYLSDAYVECPNGHREGILEGARYVVRLDGKPTLSVRDEAAAPELLGACRAMLKSHAPTINGLCKVCHHYGDDCDANKARAAIAKATGD